jgi:hypothetical protein
MLTGSPISIKVRQRISRRRPSCITLRDESLGLGIGRLSNPIDKDT